METIKEIIKSINFTTVVSSGLVAIIIGIFQLIATRYTNRLLDKVDKHILKIKKEE